MAEATLDSVYRRATELATAGATGVEAELAVIEAAGADRQLLEETRNRVARTIHGRSGDWQAGAALNLLNKALIRVGWHDPYDWKGRLGNRLRKP